MAPSLQHGRAPQPPRRRPYHPISSYLPFFVFMITLVLIVVVIVLLVLRLRAMLPAPGRQGIAARPTPTIGAIIRPGPSATTQGVTPGASVVHARGTPALLPIVFGTGYDANGGPLKPARRFHATVHRVYAFA